MADFATLTDVGTLFRTLTADEQTRVTALLPIVSDALRLEAKKVGKDLDNMIVDTPELANEAKMVTVDIIGRILRQDLSGEPLSQFSQSALGYSVSGSPIMAGGGIGSAILKNDLKRLGLRRPRYGAMEVYGYGVDKRNNGCFNG